MPVLRNARTKKIMQRVDSDFSIGIDGQDPSSMAVLGIQEPPLKK